MIRYVLASVVWAVPVGAACTAVVAATDGGPAGYAGAALWAAGAALVATPLLCRQYLLISQSEARRARH